LTTSPAGGRRSLAAVKMATKVALIVAEHVDHHVGVAAVG
jgi:hypothetical protein